MGATMEYLTASESQSGSRREIVADRRDNVGNLFVLKLGENRNRQILPRVPFRFREIVGGEVPGFPCRVLMEGLCIIQPAPIHRLFKNFLSESRSRLSITY